MQESLKGNRLPGLFVARRAFFESGVKPFEETSVDLQLCRALRRTRSTGRALLQEMYDSHQRPLKDFLWFNAKADWTFRIPIPWTETRTSNDINKQVVTWNNFIFYHQPLQ
jgi:hypothetical protein